MRFGKTFGIGFGRFGNFTADVPFGERMAFRTPSDVREQIGFFTTGLMGRIMDGTVMLTVYKAGEGEALYQAEDALNFNVAPAPLDGSEVPDGLPWKLDGVIAAEAPGSDFIGDYWLEPNTEYELVVTRVEGWKEGETRKLTYRSLKPRGNYPPLSETPDPGRDEGGSDNGLPDVLEINGATYRRET